MNKSSTEMNDKISFDSNENIAFITPPKNFSFDECLVFLDRSKNEVLHSVRDNSIYKLLDINNEKVLIKVSFKNENINIDFLNHSALAAEIKSTVAYYIWDLFDLGQDLDAFYNQVKEDHVLGALIKKFAGLRMIGIPDLFEAITWAIMGQQINLTFAYTLKRRFVEEYGTSIRWNDEVFWVFPTPNEIASLEVADLVRLQFTQRKAEYVIGIAKLIADGILSKEKLIACGSYEEKVKFLVSIRGIGNWTADYVLMKCLKETTAFPIADVGLHNALKSQLGLDKKPSIEEISRVAENWDGWEAYATFYLWRSLYG